MALSYDPQAVESDVQQRWAREKTFAAAEDPSREKFYCLSMFPYPSGRLHMGHVRNYTIGDVIARYQRLLGKNVLQPMGWDAFGLPAENAAIDRNVAPASWTRENIAYMRGQLQRLGFAYDWSREFATCDANYYRWEQWLFTRLYEQGLVYKKTAVVNWDPVDQTVLANEQVVNGRGWRSGAVVERREIPQWFIRITDYAEELLAGIDTLEGWPDSVRTMQRNWIGRSVGVEVDFTLLDAPAGVDAALTVYTTRPDTLYGVSYLALAPEHPLVSAVAEQDAAIAEFVQACASAGVSEASLEAMEKDGRALGMECRHPLTGQPVALWVANFVLMGYGTGAVMSVPAHDQRDWEFARRFGLPVKPVVFPLEGELDVDQGAYTERGVLRDSGDFSGLDSAAAFDAIAQRLEQDGLGRRTVNFRLRDWGVSRQRYWGCPIPMLSVRRGEDQDSVAVEPGDLPVVLPEEVEFGGVQSPLKQDPSFAEVASPAGWEHAERETDTFDTFIESSWYYARFCCPDADSMLDERARYWLPVDQYVGGIEHAVLHLLYARFFHKLLRDQGLVDGDEPFKRLLTQGMVVAETFYREQENGKKIFFNPADVDVLHDDKGAVAGATLKADGEPVTVGAIEKMSKSKNNGVDPQALVERYGADTVRLYTMFAAPPDQSLEWSDSGVEGASRFIKRFWRMVQQHVALGPVAPRPAELSKKLVEARRLIHETIAKVDDDVGRRYTFNTAIAKVMELLNGLQQIEGDDAATRAVRQEGLETAVQLLMPIIPHAAEVMWQQLVTDTARSPRWPQVDQGALVRDSLTLVVQVNGKKRGEIEVAADADKGSIEETAIAEPNVVRFIADKAIRKVVVVPGRLVNIVVSG